MKLRKSTPLLAASTAISLSALTLPHASAMHIMEGYLPVTHAAFWGAVSLPFLIAGILSIRKTVNENRKSILLLAMMGAFAFVLSALKIPSVTGSSSHPTGTGLGAVMFGPTAMTALGTIVLLFQAILLAHGGLTTLGANVFSMAIAGPFVSYFVYKLCRGCKLSTPVAVGIACGLGDLATYCVTSLQLGFAHPSEVGGVAASIVKFMGVFAITQIPLAIIEGILSAIVIMLLSKIAKPELKSIGFLAEKE